MTDNKRPPFPPFSYDDAVVKARKAENAWNLKQPEAVAMAYTPDSRWRNRNMFINGRDEIVAFLQDKWTQETYYKLIKEVWAFTDNRIAVRFAYEFQDSTDQQWFRAYGNENWEFDENGLMKSRHASINDVPISDSERLLTWEGAIRPDDFPSLSELNL